MKTYTITEQQLEDIQSALHLAEYFCQEHQDRTFPEQEIIDNDTYQRAVKAMKEVTA